MATDFTQDAVLYFLQSSGGSVKNSDLLLHFRNFIRDHADRDKNRDLFKKFVNSVATVKQVDGVSYVILRKRFKGHIAHGDEGVSTGPPRPPAGRSADPAPEKTKEKTRKFADQPQQNHQQREVTAPAPPAGTGEKILPAAGIMLNNNNVETNYNLKLKHLQVTSRPQPSAVPAAAQMVSQISEKTQLKTPSLSELPAQDQCTREGQRGVGIGPHPGITPMVKHHGEPRQQELVPQPLRGREASPQPVGGLQQQPPLHHLSAHSQVATRRIRHRPSYKSAVSYDEDDDEEEEVSIRRGSAGGVWPLSTPLGDTRRAISTSSPCIIDPPGPPSVASSSSERNPPKIYIQGVEEEALAHGGSGWSLGSGVEQRRQWAGPGGEPGSVLRESSPTRHHLILEANRHMPSPEQTTKMAPHHDGHVEHRYSKPTSVQLEPRQGPVHNQRLSSSHSSILSPSSDTGHSSSDWPPSGSPRGLGWNSSYEDLQVRTGEAKIQEVLQRAQMTRSGSATPPGNKTTVPWHRSTGQLDDDHEPTSHLAPFHRSTDHLHDNQQSPARVLPWHLSTGDLYDDWEEAESSEGSTSTKTRRQRPAVARRVSSQLRNRMCRSMGADLDQLLQEEAMGGGGGGNEAARLNRLHLISSSLCLRYNLSSSSLSSCSTPPRCHSLADLVEGVEGKGERRSLPATSSSCNHESPSRQSLVPLEPKEHAWLVKAAAGAWPDIYSLFREDSSLLNRRDFISGFTVLHWIAKHGDHRVLNTLWYGVEKAGLTFDINARSTCGHTPLHIAALHDNRNIIRLLVSKYSADVRLRDTAGKKPWQYLKRTMPPDIFKLLGAPAWAAQGQERRVVEVDSSWKREQQPRRRRRHHLSSASSGEKPFTISGTAKVKRSSSLAAFLKHKSLHRFHGHQSDSSV